MRDFIDVMPGTGQLCFDPHLAFYFSRITDISNFYFVTMILLPAILKCTLLVNSSFFNTCDT
jgi:hypothetical protein